MKLKNKILPLLLLASTAGKINSSTSDNGIDTVGEFFDNIHTLRSPKRI